MRKMTPSYVYFQSYGHLNVKNDLFNVLSAQYRKNTDPVCARYLNAFERTYLTLLQNTMDFGVVTYH